MKKIILTLGTVFMLTASVKSQEILLETNKINYGTVEYGSDGHREVVITNVGKEPLFIKDVIGQCGCTATIENNVPGWPLEPILPNGKGIIKFKYDTKREGRFDKFITIHSNDITGDKVIYIHGTVKPNVK